VSRHASGNRYFTNHFNASGGNGGIIRSPIRASILPDSDAERRGIVEHEAA
jgi:hypothetical protein